MSCAFDHEKARSSAQAGLPIRRALPPQEWFSAAELADMALPGLPATKRGIQDVAGRERWAEAVDDQGSALARPRRARGGGVEYHLSVLPHAARMRVMAPAPADGSASRGQRPAPADVQVDNRESAWARYDRLPTSMKAEAKRRLEIVQRVEALCRAGLGKAKAMETIQGQDAREARARGEAKAPYGMSALYSWFGMIGGCATPDRLAYLAPRHLGRTATSDCSEAAWLLFKSEYLTNSRQSAAAAWAKVALIGQAEGWTVPSAKTLLARIAREIEPMTLVFLREGQPGLERKFPTPRRDIAEVAVMEAVNVDGHEIDVMVEWADGTVGRPMMIGIQDLASRKMLVTLIGRSESSDLVRRAFAELFKTYGIPKEVTFDNGRAFASKWLTGGNPTRYRFVIRPEDPIGLLTQLGCNVHFTKVYSGRSKPIERAFRDFCDGFARSGVFAGAYTGNNVLNKPADYGSRAIPYADFAKELAFYVHLHNARPGRRTQNARGISFDQAFAEGLERTLVPRATEEQLRLALLAAEGVTVRQKTAQLHMGGNTYFHEALWGLEGQKVIVRFEPENLHAPIHVYRLDGVYVCEAACVEAVGFYNAEAAKEIGRQQRRILKDAKRLAGAQQLLDAKRLAALRPDLPEPEDQGHGSGLGDNVVAPVFGSLALQLHPRHAVEPDELTEAQVIEFHSRAMGQLQAAQE